MKTRSSCKRTTRSASEASNGSKRKSPTAAGVNRRSKRTVNKSVRTAAKNNGKIHKSRRKRRTMLSSLPVEMISHILGFLGLYEQMRLAKVSRGWREAVNVSLARCQEFPAPRTYSLVTGGTLEKLLPRLPGLRRLTSIDGRDLDVDIIDCNELTEAGLKRLGHLKELRSLDLTHSKVTDAVLRQLNGAAHLTKLSVGSRPVEDPLFSPECLARLAASCPALETLVVYDWWRTPAEVQWAQELVSCLRSQLSPDRRLTLKVLDWQLACTDVEELESGPLCLVNF